MNAHFRPTASVQSPVAYTSIQSIIAPTRFLVGVPKNPVPTVWLRLWDAGDSDWTSMYIGRKSVA